MPQLITGQALLRRRRGDGTGGLSPALALGVLCPLIVVSFAVALALGIAAYPTPFDVRHQWISSLASAKRNPGGYFYVGTGLVLVALLLVPLRGYLSHGAHAPAAARSVGALLLGIGITTLFLLGVETTVFPNYGRNRPIHRLLSAVTLSTLTLGFATLTVSRVRATTRRWWRVWLACGVLLAPAVGAALTSLLLHLGAGAPGWAISRQAKQTAPAFHTLAFWEWAAVTALFTGGYLCAWAISPHRASRRWQRITAPFAGEEGWPSRARMLQGAGTGHALPGVDVDRRVAAG